MASIAERAHELLKTTAHGGIATSAALAATDATAAALAATVALKATDSLVVHLAGTETVTGAKTFNSTITSAAGVGLLLPSNSIIRWTNAAAAVQNLLQLTSGDIFKIGSTGFTMPVTIDAGGTSTITLRTNNVDRLTVSSSITVGEGIAFVLGTTTGSKIGSAANQKIGFYGATAIVQPASTSAAATDLATVITLANDLRTKLLALGLIA